MISHPKGVDVYASLLVSLANLLNRSTYHDWHLTFTEVRKAIKKLERAKLSKI